MSIPKISDDQSGAPGLPVVLLAFANDLEGESYLRDLPEEARELKAVLRKAKDHGLCEFELIYNARLDEISDAFKPHARRVVIFHFGGHAGPDCLRLEESENGRRLADADSLARWLGRQGGLQLVFLNGCSTAPQVAALHNAGIDAVVATARPIDDTVARTFAVEFYDLLAHGRTFRDAFELTSEKIRNQHGNALRDLVRPKPVFEPGDIAGDQGLPWRMSIRTGADLVNHVTLPQLANNPLLGLPPLPPSSWLPPAPYQHLHRFTKDCAQVFFGRGKSIADLFHLATSPNPRRVILYSGPTGVGKSSLLDAGLRPRLEAAGPPYEVVYVGRNASAGLLGTLRIALGGTGDRSRNDLFALWHDRDRLDRPLLVILDQAEEAFSAGVHPRAGTTPPEVTELVDALKNLFADPVRRAHGRLILSFRKEWLQDFERAFDDARLGYEPLKLGPLDHAGIVQAIEGPTRDPDLIRHYNLTVEKGLAGLIATELQSDAGSALAPTLQVLLTKLWTSAGGKGAAFTREKYYELKKQGFLLDDVLEEGLKTLRAWLPDVVDSGFALDLLEYHTTPHTTAESRTHADLLGRYPHWGHVLDECLRRSQGAYLLIPADFMPASGHAAAPSAGEPVPTRLAHDTLASLVQQRFRNSPAPGQRARRLLEGRATDWKDGRKGTPLNRKDLKEVEAGKPGMRDWTNDERRLVAASRQARRIWGAIAASVVALCSGLAFWGASQQLSAIQSGRRAEQRLATSYLRGIGQSSQITSTELETLRALAREESPRVRLLFFEQALANSGAARQLANRYPEIVLYGVRFDTQLRRQVHDLVLKSLKGAWAAPASKNHEIALAAILVGLEIGSPRLEQGSEFASEAVDVLLDSGSGYPSASDCLTLIGQISDPKKSPAAAKFAASISIDELEAYVTQIPASTRPEVAKSVADLSLKLAASASTDPDDLEKLALAVKAVVPQINEQEALAVANRAVLLAPNVRFGNLSLLSQLVAALPGDPPSGAARAVAEQALALSTDISGGEPKNLVAILKRVLPLLRGADSKSVADRIVATADTGISRAWFAPVDVLAALPSDVRPAVEQALDDKVVVQVRRLTFTPFLAGVSELPAGEKGRRAIAEQVVSLIRNDKYYVPKAIDAPFLVDAVAQLPCDIGKKAAQAVAELVVQVARDAANQETLSILADAVTKLPCDTGTKAAQAVAERVVSVARDGKLNDLKNLPTLADAVAKLPGDTGKKAAQALAERIVQAANRVEKVDIFGSDDAIPILADAVTKLPGDTGTKAAEAVADRVVSLAGATKSLGLPTLAGAVAKLPADARMKAAPTVSTRIVQIMGETEAVNLPNLSDAVAKLPADAGTEAAKAVADRLMAELLTKEDGLPGFLSKCLSTLETKLDAPRLARLIREPGVDWTVRRGLIRAVERKLRPDEPPTWQRPWDVADWLAAHRHESAEAAEVDRILRESLLSPTTAAMSSARP